MKIWIRFKFLKISCNDVCSLDEQLVALGVNVEKKKRFG